MQDSFLRDAPKAQYFSTKGGSPLVSTFNKEVGYWQLNVGRKDGSIFLDPPGHLVVLRDKVKGTAFCETSLVAEHVIIRIVAETVRFPVRGCGW